MGSNHAGGLGECVCLLEKDVYGIEDYLRMVDFFISFYFFLAPQILFYTRQHWMHIIFLIRNKSGKTDLNIMLPSLVLTDKEFTKPSLTA